VLVSEGHNNLMGVSIIVTLLCEDSKITCGDATEFLKCAFQSNQT